MKSRVWSYLCLRFWFGLLPIGRPLGVVRLRTGLGLDLGDSPVDSRCPRIDLGQHRCRISGITRLRDLYVLVQRPGIAEIGDSDCTAHI
jgi:hypothetical protein